LKELTGLQKEKDGRGKIKIQK